MAVIRNGGNALAVSGEGAARLLLEEPVANQGPVEGNYVASSFRLTGTATTPINLATIRNQPWSNTIVALRRLAVDVNASGAVAYLLQSYFRLWLDTGVIPSGGVQADKVALKGVPSARTTEVLFAASADGVAAPIVHPVPTDEPARSNSHPQIFSNVSYTWFPTDFQLQRSGWEPLILRPGQTALLALHGANSAAHFHYVVKMQWDEFAI
jgi:hypothetical protein